MGDDRVIYGTSPRRAEPEAGRADSPPAFLRYGEIFEKECGRYLYYGMTPEQYWDGDCEMVKWYRDKMQVELEHRNELLWLQGRYLYDILLRVSPALKPFVKNPRPEPYIEKPYDVSTKTDKEQTELKNEQKMKNGFEYFTALANRINSTMNTEKEVMDSDGTDGRS